MYLNTKTKEYPRFQGDLELLGWVPGEPLPENWVLVTPTELPEPGEDEVIEESEPFKSGNAYIQSWTTRPMTAEEKRIRDLPIAVNAKLAGLGFTEDEIGFVLNGRRF